MKNNWTHIQIFLIYQQLLALIIIYLMSLPCYIVEFVPKISLVSVSFWLVSVLFFLGHPVSMATGTCRLTIQGAVCHISMATGT